MTDIYGLKISQPGYDVKTTGDTHLAFDSRFDSLKVKQQGTGQITDSSRTITIAHNLGYVPAFLVHSQFYDGGVYYISPLKNTQPLYSGNLSGAIWAWADSTNLYVKANGDLGQERFYQQAYYDTWGAVGGNGGNDVFTYGHQNFNGTGYDRQGALRFEDITYNKNTSLASAELHIYTSDSQGSGNLKGIFFGIDEDNTSLFTGDPMSRNGTDAQTHDNRSLPGSNNWLTIDIRTAMNEILARSGWSNGNSIAFKVFNEGSSDNCYIRDTTFSSFLQTRISNTLANFKYTIFYNKII